MNTSTPSQIKDDQLCGLDLALGFEPDQLSAAAAEDAIDEGAAIGAERMLHHENPQYTRHATSDYDLINNCHLSEDVPIDPALEGTWPSQLVGRGAAVFQHTADFSGQSLSDRRVDNIVGIYNGSAGRQYPSSPLSRPYYAYGTDLPATAPAMFEAPVNHCSSNDHWAHGSYGTLTTLPASLKEGWVDASPFDHGYGALATLPTPSARRPLDFSPDNPYQDSNTTTMHVRNDPKGQPAAASTTNILDWCKSMGYVPSDIVLPQSKERVRWPLEPFLSLTPVRQLSDGGRSLVAWKPGKKPFPNWYALFCQVAGVPAITPCEKCSRGKAIWSECIVAPTPESAERMRGSCAACMYGEMGTKCSFYQAWKPRISKVSKLSIDHAATSGPPPVPSFRPLLPAPRADRFETARDGRQVTATEEMEQLFNELAENEREMAEGLKRREDIELRLLACEIRLSAEHAQQGSSS